MSSSRHQRAPWLVIPAAVALLISSCAQPGGGTPTTSPGGVQESPTPVGTSTDTAAEEGPIRIGVTAPISGRGADWGPYMTEGTNLAAEEINEAGGVMGREIEIFVEDTESDSTIAAQVTQKLILENDVHVIISSAISLDTLGQLPVAEDADIPVIVPIAVAAQIAQQGYEWMVAKLNVSDNYNNVALATYAVEELGATRVGILAENSDYGRPPSEAFAATVEHYGAEVVAHEYFNPGDTDFTAQLTKIAAGDPDLFFMHALPSESPALARQRQQLGLDGIPFLVNAGQGSPVFHEQAGAAAEGAQTVITWSPDIDTPESRQFVDRYTATYDGEPNQFIAQAYDAVKLVAWAVEQSGGSTQSTVLREAIRASDGEFVGAINPYTFNDRGEVEWPLRIMEVQGGTWVVTDTEVQADPEWVAELLD